MDDRTIQHTILTYLNKEFLKVIATKYIPGNDITSFNRCMHYLYEHKLIDGYIMKPIGLDSTFADAKITAKGIDFLADDGGLSAILGVVTIKIHPDSVKAIIDAKIEASPLPGESKSKLKEAIRNAPSTVVAEVLTCPKHRLPQVELPAVALTDTSQGGTSDVAPTMDSLSNA